MQDPKVRQRTLYETGPHAARSMAWVTPAILQSQPFKAFLKRMPEVTWENWADPNVKRRNLLVLQQKSTLTREVIANRQGWLFPEKVYLGDPCYLSQAPEHHDSIDRFIMRQPMCHSLRTRFHYVSDVLVPHCIRNFLSQKGRVRIASFGSGTGRDVLESIGNFVDEDVTVDFYDVDSNCLDVGKQIAEKNGLGNKTRFIQRDFARLCYEPYDLGLLVGVICAVPDRQAVIAMKKIRRLINTRDGILIVSSSSEKMELGDVLSRFLIEYTSDWFLNFRSKNSMRRICQKARYDAISLTTEPTGYHRFVIGSPS